MDNQEILSQWHKKIIGICEATLHRVLSDEERNFICRRGAFVALEMIEDSVRAMSASELVKYLSSEIGN